MKKVIKTIILILISATAYAEPFTILAKSGLNVRKEPNSKSEKVALLPFGTVVDAAIYGETDIDYKYRYKHFSEVIEGKQGFWMSITHGQIKGYIFSGFGIVGQWVVPSTAINKDYRLLRVGAYCDPVNYDPKLNWYALTKANGKMFVKKSEVTLRLTHEFNEQDTLGGEHEFWQEFPLIVNSNLTDTILFLIGTKEKLEEGAIFSPIIPPLSDYDDNKKFLFPEQTYDFYCKGVNYQFHAFEDVKLTKDNPNGYINRYQLELKTKTQTAVKKYNFSKALELSETAEMHSAYRTPQMIFLGDINNDGLPDFIYSSHPMIDHCGGWYEYHLFMSDQSNPDKPIRKVADQKISFCIS